MDDDDKIEIRIRRPVRRRLLAFLTLTVIGTFFPHVTLPVFFIGLLTGIITFAFWVCYRLLQSDFFACLLWLFPLMAYGYAFDLSGPELASKRFVELIPPFSLFTFTAFLSGTILQAMFDRRLMAINRTE